MTITEAILAKHAGKKEVSPGDNIWIDVDVLMTHDVCGPPTIDIFKREFGENARVWDPEKVVIIPDHYIFTRDPFAKRNVEILRQFAREQELPYYYDVDTVRYKGVCHVALAEEGFTLPGQVLFGTDSHTCTAGAFGMFATGIGNTDAAFVMGTGKLWVRVPGTIRFEFDGEIPYYVMAKDLILKMIGDIGVEGATYCALEFAGTGIEAMDMENRMTLANMAIEAGAKNGIIEPDDVTFDFLRMRTTREYEPIFTDGTARYWKVIRHKTQSLEPVVAKPHSPGNTALARKCKNIQIDRAYIGSCTGGKIVDFYAAARILNGHQVGVPTYAVPATREVEQKLHTLKIQGKTIHRILTEAGVNLGPPSCAACLGGPADTFGRINSAEVCISTTNRNFPGRMGAKQAEIYLASPYTVAASAIRGKITDPREFI